MKNVRTTVKQSNSTRTFTASLAGQLLARSGILANAAILHSLKRKALSQGSESPT
jgi:hypothetical protein